MNLLTRYWIEFSKDSLTKYPGLGLGCGVTAYDLMDAQKMLSREFFKVDEIPEIIKVIENVDVRTLEQNHVLKNLGVVVFRGIWYPNVSWRICPPFN